jgi:hypothetical protein
MIMRVFFIFFCLIFVSGCSTTVKFAATNGEKWPVNIIAVVKDKNGSTQKEIDIGLLQTQQTLNQDFEVDNDGQFEIVANKPDSAVIFKERRSVTGKPDPDHELVTIFNQSITLDETRSLNILSDSFKKLGDDIGASPRDLKDSLETVFGAIVVAIPNANDKPGKILRTVTPVELGVQQATLNDIPIFQNNESQKTTLTGTSALQAKTEIGPYAAFGGQYDLAKLYTLEWNLRGFGIVQKHEDQNRQYVIQLKKLPLEVRQDLYDILHNNSSAKLYYINKMYVIRQADLTIKEHRKVDNKGNFNVANIVTASGVFSNDFSNETTKHYGDVVLNFFGDVLGSNIPLTESAESQINNATLKPTGEHQDISPENLTKE